MIIKWLFVEFLSEEHPKYYHKVNVEYHFYGSILNENKIRKAVKLSDDNIVV